MTKVEGDQLGRLLKSPIFVKQRAAAPKNGVEFCQKFLRAIRLSVATSYNDMRRGATSVPLLTMGVHTHFSHWLFSCQALSQSKRGLNFTRSYFVSSDVFKENKNYPMNVNHFGEASK